MADNATPAVHGQVQPLVVRWIARPSAGYWYMRWYHDGPIKIVWIGRPYSNDNRLRICEHDVGPRFLLAGFLRVHRSAEFARVPMPHNAKLSGGTPSAGAAGWASDREEPCNATRPS